MTNSIIFQENNETGIILLNNPKTLNALDLEMAELFFSKLIQWQNNNNIKRVLLKGEGKAFCAGGDIRALYDWGRSGDTRSTGFYYEEYKLNRFIKRFPNVFDNQFQDSEKEIFAELFFQISTFPK